METADTQIKQKTSRESCPAENRVEAEGMQGAPSVSAGFKNGRNGDRSTLILAKRRMPGRHVRVEQVGWRL